ncbi:TauD/TfdA dioxygenase family protein [Vibrio coralliilyticus]|uniref:TauD/TfdA dioxygenase family protein n=1 Tax=Vibrio coralliilyticus TaxID=190893 RepID=UPI0015601AB8|nr:TauD/TfdA family dioxygenase [Vibrio coralliilyticus]
MNLTPLSEHIGALVEGVDLSNLSEQEFDALYQAYLKHKVLFFRDQGMTPQQQIGLAKRFGDLEPVHPFFPHLDDEEQVVVIETSPGNPPGESFWHTDLTWQAIPCRCSILQAQHCPPHGGDTIWTSMEAVWSSLTSDEQHALQGLTATHGLHAFEGSRYDSVNEQGESRVATVSQGYPPVKHPLVVRHPETGNLTAYVNEQFTHRINELEERESRKRLEQLFALARQPEYQVQFSWQPGSVAIWDNICTQHFAVTDYGDQPRRLHRVTVRGSDLLPA